MVVDVIRLVDTNKAKFAFLAPLVVTCLGIAASWVATGEFNADEIRLAVAGVVASISASVGTYFAAPGKAEVASR